MVTITLQGNTVSEIYAQMREFLNGQDDIVKRATVVMGPLTGQQVEEIKKVAVDMPEVKSIREVEVAAPTEDKPQRRKRRTKAEMEAAKSAPSHAEDIQNQMAAEHESEESAGDESPAVIQMQKQTTATAAPIANKEAVHQALQQVNVAVGLSKARDILQSFGVNRISELKETQFKPFIEKCNEAVMLEG